MPVATEEVKRRQYKRKKVRRQRAMIVRLWLRDPMKGGEGRFMYSKPAMEINVKYHISKMDKERVFDVSERGIRVGLIRQLLGNITPRPGEGVCLEIKPFIKNTRKFDSFLFGGVIRHVYTTPGDMVVVGVEFTLIGKREMRVGDVIYKWQDINKAKDAKSFLWAIKQL